MPFEDRSLGYRLSRGGGHDVHDLLGRRVGGHGLRTLAPCGVLSQPFLADELVAAEERSDPTQDGHRDGGFSETIRNRAAAMQASDMRIQSTPWVRPSANVSGSGLPAAKAQMRSPT